MYYFIRVYKFCNGSIPIRYHAISVLGVAPLLSGIDDFAV